MDCPLISLKPCGHNYFLWIEALEADTLLLKVTDGYKVWEQSIRAAKHKPKSRKESDSEYITLILSCLQHLDTEKRDYGVTITASGSLQIMIKERLGSMMALLLKLDMTEDFDATTSIRCILSGACDACANSTRSLSDATKDIQLQREANDSLSQTIHSYATSKEDFQNDFFKKYLIILNSKKREVRRLQEEVIALEEEVCVLKANNVKKKPTPASKSKSKSKKPKVAKKEESEEEEEGEKEEEDASDDSAGDYSIHSGDENTQDSASDHESSELSEEEDEDAHASQQRVKGRPKAKGKSKVIAAATATARANSKRNPPSYSQQPTKGLLKKRKTTGDPSQVISQVLAPAAGATETTGGDLTRILSQSKRTSRRVIADTQEEEEDSFQQIKTSSAAKCSYNYEDAGASEEEFDCDAGGDSVKTADEGGTEIKKASTVVVKKRKQSAFDKHYNNDSSSEEEEDGGNLMDFL